MVHQSVSISPIPSRLGEHVTITYNGMLSSSGAEEIWIHTGYGQETWESIYDYPMYRNGDSWSQTIKVQETGQLNFCFKDNANNWDNNHGLNWIFRIAK